MSLSHYTLYALIAFKKRRLQIFTIVHVHTEDSLYWGVRMAVPADTCTLVWPIERDADGAVPDAFAGRSAWLVGWNPRGLSVVVCGFFHSISHNEAVVQLKEIKSMLKDYSPLYGSLHVLGYIEGTTTAASGSMTARRASALEVDKARSLARQSEDVWLQLQPGPTLGEVWCCGYRVHGCQLHVIRCSPSRRYAVSPDIFSPTALYGPGGLHQLLNGQSPLCVRGALSSLEGVLLPGVMREESAPLQQGKGPLTDLLKTTSTVERGDLSVSFVDEPDDITGPHYENSSFYMGKNASMGDGRMSVADSFFVPNTSSYHPPQMEDVPLELLPPRLDFPTSTKNHSEMSMLLRLCYTGVNVSRVINSKTPYELKEEPNEMSRRTESSHLGEAMALNDTGVFILQVVIQLLLFALKVETAIAPFSFVAQTLEVRTRELINFFSMILGKTSTCGLHPVLPHKEHAVSFLMCTWSFLVRIFVDFLLGLSFYVCFHALFHHKFDSFPFYFLYDVHMSYMEWFAGWPAGFKANEDVNKILCFFSSVLLTMWNLIARGGVFLRVASFGGTMPLQESVLTAMQDAISVANSTCSAYNYQSSNVSTTVSFSLADRHPEVYVWLDFGVLLTCLFGASVALSAFADATRLASLHLTILFGIFSRLYDVVLSLIGSLSGLFRGLKYNPLRCRVDGHQFQTDQMLFASFFSSSSAACFPLC
ncbi:N-acetylglucosaminyl transferase component [Strigomonas culicis]|uniref:N-acetylglucosaminyl transferase component n=1 Tax=Strigomonas culicis TaxID=28005 RepID=S9U4F2_9TRYP|nr:N-acetylglucosaminyl transferase component [Strigomonas culicis]|eukprot:EPY23649.1 N-acetylglucosaminyl transferase component [Strigomonas culicis]